MYTLDLRTLAGEWQDLLDELDPEAHDIPLTEDERADIESACEKYESLADEICGDATPSGLELHANNYEPTLIAESDFEDYARELAEEIGAIPEDNQWPLYCIDWERAARELSMDYTSVSYDGTDFFIQSC